MNWTVIEELPPSPWQVKCRRQMQIPRRLQKCRSLGAWISALRRLRGQIDDALLDQYDSGLLLALTTVDTKFPAEFIVTLSGYRVHCEIIEHERNTCPDIVNSVVFLNQASQLRCIVSLNNPAGEPAKAQVRRFDVARHLGIVFSDSHFTRGNRMLRPSMKIDRKNIVAG